MKAFQGKVAVITGGASGIGLGIAKRLAKEKMKIVLADIEEQSLTQTERELKAGGASVLSVVTDVSKASDVETLAQKTLDAFSSVHLLFNNAGINAGTTIWESSLADWEWLLGVNLWGVIHGIRTFVPIMLKQDAQSHIVNTASMAGLISGVGIGLYKVSKHGVVSLSETLYSELKLIKAPIDVSVLCPGYIHTNFLKGERNRPAKLQNDPDEEKIRKNKAEYQIVEQALQQGVGSGASPEEVADCVFRGIRENKFYILVNPGEHKDLANMRAENIIHERNPQNPLDALDE